MDCPLSTFHVGLAVKFVACIRSLGPPSRGYLEVAVLPESRRTKSRDGKYRAASTAGGASDDATQGMLCRLRRDLYAAFSVRHFFEQVSENGEGYKTSRITQAMFLGSS